MFKSSRIAVSTILLSLLISLPGCVHQPKIENEQVSTSLVVEPETETTPEVSMPPEHIITDSSQETGELLGTNIQNNMNESISSDETAICDIFRLFAEAY